MDISKYMIDLEEFNKPRNVNNVPLKYSVKDEKNNDNENNSNHIEYNIIVINTTPWQIILPGESGRTC